MVINNFKAYYDKYIEIINYLIIGGLTTLVSLSVYYICVLTFLDPTSPMQLQIANIISWIAAVTFAYYANKKYVFNNNNRNISKEILLFYLFRVNTLLIDMSIMFVAVTLLGINDKIAKLIVQVIVTIANYILSKFFVFNEKDLKKKTT